MRKIIFIFFFIVFVTGCVTVQDLVGGEQVLVDEVTDEVVEESEEGGTEKKGYVVEQKVIEEEIKEENICLYFFHNNRGSPCIREKEFLFKLQKKYSNLIVKEFITNTKEDTKLLYDLAEKYNFEVEFVPITFIGEEVIFGYYDDSTTGKQMEEIIEGCVDCGCPSID